MNKYIGFILCLASSIFCSNRTNISSFEFKDLEKAPVLSLADVLEPIRFIPLKTSETYNLSNILKVCMSEDSFYILTVNPFGVFRFSFDGSLISTISVEGRAEGEYLIPTEERQCLVHCGHCQGHHEIFK